MNINACLSSNKNYWETPQQLYDLLNEEFHFTLDPCASHENHKCDKYYTMEDDGLSKTWCNEVVFCNPPYGPKTTGDWVKKCDLESKHSTVVMLIPSRTDTKWFHEYIWGKHEVRFIKGRLKFELNGEPIRDKNNRVQSAPFPSMIVVMKPEDHMKRR